MSKKSLQIRAIEKFKKDFEEQQKQKAKELFVPGKELSLLGANGQPLKTK